MSFLEGLSLSPMEGSRYQEDVEEPHEGVGHVPDEAKLVVNMEVRFKECI